MVGNLLMLHAATASHLGVQGKVHGGHGVPRTASLPQLAAGGSDDASPEGRAHTALANSASAPAVPPPGLAGVQPAGGEERRGPVAGSLPDALRPSSAPPSSHSQPGARSFRSATAPGFPSSPEWPGMLAASQALFMHIISSLAGHRAGPVRQCRLITVRAVCSLLQKPISSSSVGCLASWDDALLTPALCVFQRQSQPARACQQPPSRRRHSAYPTSPGAARA